MSIKVCHMTSVHNRYDIRIFEKECVTLAKYGYDVTLIVNDNNSDEIKKKVKIISINFTPKNRMDRIINSKKRILKKAIQINAEIYHLHDPELLPIGMQLIKRGKKVIYDSHEDVPRQILAKEWIPTFLRRFIATIFEKYENNIVKKMAALVVPTPHLAHRFSQINNNVFQVCNFPLLSEFEEHDRQMINNVGCYIGGISINRGIRQMAEATKKANIDLNLCGKFASLKLEDEITTSFQHIKYWGFLDRKGVSEVLFRSTIGFVTLLPTPNHLNSYPIKMFEYMAAGIPVIVSDFPLWREIIQKHRCGICVNPNSIDEIEKAIKYLIENPDKAKVMGENGRRAVIQEYNWDIQEKILLELYKKI